MAASGKSARSLVLVTALAVACAGCASLAQLQSECTLFANHQFGGLARQPSPAQYQAAIDECIRDKQEEAAVGFGVLIMVMFGLGYLVAQGRDSGGSRGSSGMSE
jgi:hypothetical protein